MREILFRGKRTDNGEMVFGDLIHGVGDKRGKTYILPISSIYPKDCNNLDGYEVNPYTVGQFSGLVDCKGNKIFDGDIVNDTTNNQRYVVIYRHGAFYVKVLSDGIMKGRSFSICDHFTVTDEVNVNGVIKIGNIHDNPEMMEVSNG